MDNGGGVELLDDRRAGERRGGRQRIAVVDRAVDVAVRLGEVDGPVLLRLGFPPASSGRGGGFAIVPTLVSRRLTTSTGSSGALNP